MMKKRILATFILSILIAFLVPFFQRATPVHTIIDVTIDNKGNFYYLKEENGENYLINLNQKGEIIFSKKLEKIRDVNYMSYTDIVADDTGHIYVLSDEAAETGRRVKQYITVFDSKGKMVKKLFEIQNQRRGEKVKSLSTIQFINNTIVVFLLGEDSSFIKLNYDPVSGQTWENAYEMEKSEDINEILYDGNNGIYFTNNHSQLFFINENNVVKEISSAIDEIPYCISVNPVKKEVYFTDVHHFTFNKYDVKSESIQTIYFEEEAIGNELVFSHLRDFKYENGFFIGHSPIFESNQNIIYSKNNDTVITIGQKIMRFSQMIKLGGILFLFSFIILFGMITLVHKFYQSRRILVKMGVMLTCVMILLTFTIVMIFRNTMILTVEREIYNQLYMLSTSIAKNIDGDELKKVDFPQADGDAYYTEISQKVNLETSAFYDACPEAIAKDFYYTLYYIKDGKSYIGFDIIAEGSTNTSGMYEGYQVDSNLTKKLLEDGMQNKVVLASTTDLSGKWMACPTMIFDSSGNLAGYFEIGTDQSVVDRSINEVALGIGIGIACIMIGIEVLLLIIMKRFLRGIKKLKTGVEAIIEGDWTVTVDIATNDEIEDIGNAFNRMTNRIKRYLDSIVALNKACERFIPSELFKLIGKETIMDVSLGDQKMQNMSLLSINTKNYYEISRVMTVKDNFNFMNKLFSILAGAVKSTGGIIEGYYGAGLRAIYHQSSDTALNAALKAMEMLLAYNLELSKMENNCKISMNAVIHNGEFMLGVVGDSNRMAATVLSDAVNCIYDLNLLAEENNINLLITGTVYEKIDIKNHYHFRYIGKFKNSIEDTDFIDLYDCLDAYDYECRETKMITREKFQAGVQYYIKGEFLEARKCFIDAVRLDNSDELAKSYIFLCDRFRKESNQDWNGTIELHLK